MPETPQYADHTQLACAERCEREFVYRYVQHWRSARLDASASFGQLVHDLVRQLYLGSAISDVPALGSALLDERKPHLTPAYATAIARMYASLYFPLTEWTLVLNERYLESARLGSCGIVDRVVRWQGDGKLYVSDLKTTGLYISDAWLGSFAHSAQLAGYMDLVEEACGEPVAGAWVDAIHLNRKGIPVRDDFVRHGPLVYTAGVRAELGRERAQRSARLNILRSAPHLALKSANACFR